MKTLLYLSAMLLMATSIRAQGPTDTYVTLGGKKISSGKESTPMSKQEILTAGGLVPLNTSLIVVEYKFSIVGRDFEYREIQGKGSKLNDEMIEALKNAPSGAKIYFEYIKCASRDGDSARRDVSTRTMSPLSIVLK